MRTVEGEVVRYIRIPADLSLAVTERLNTERHLFRAGMALDDLIIPFLQAYVDLPKGATRREVAISEALARVRQG